jgi:hypothetical protein
MKKTSLLLIVTFSMMASAWAQDEAKIASGATLFVGGGVLANTQKAKVDNILATPNETVKISKETLRDFLQRPHQTPNDQSLIQSFISKLKSGDKVNFAIEEFSDARDEELNRLVEEKKSLTQRMMRDHRLEEIERNENGLSKAQHLKYQNLGRDLFAVKSMEEDKLNAILANKKLSEVELKQQLTQFFKEQDAKGHKFVGAAIERNTKLMNMTKAKRLKKLGIVSMALGLGSLLKAANSNSEVSKSDYRLDNSNRSIASKDAAPKKVIKQNSEGARGL